MSSGRPDFPAITVSGEGASASSGLRKQGLSSQGSGHTEILYTDGMGDTGVEHNHALDVPVQDSM